MEKPVDMGKHAYPPEPGMTSMSCDQEITSRPGLRAANHLYAVEAAKAG